MTLRLLVDAELLAVNYLRATAEVAAIAGSRIYTEIPPTPTYPLVRVTRIGGVPTIRQHLDVARLQIDVWGQTKFQARTLAATVQAAMWAAVGSHAEGVVANVEDDLGLSWSPDPDTDQPRYVFGVAVTIHPNPTS